MSSIPLGARVSITAVPATIGLKFDFTGLPLSSFPSLSPARDWVFLNADSEFDPANSGAMAIRTRRSKRGSLFIDGSPLVSGLRCGNGDSNTRLIVAFGRDREGKDSKRSALSGAMAEHGVSQYKRWPLAVRRARNRG